MIFGEMLRDSGHGYADQLIRLSEDGTITHLFPADTTRNWRNNQATLIQHTLWNTAESKHNHHPTDNHGLIITAWARIDNRADLAQILKFPFADPTISDGDIILSSYRKWGENCVSHLIGDFAFAIYDTSERKLFCARDHIGTRPFYYHLSDQYFVFTTSVALFHQLDGFKLEPSRQWMAEFIVDLSMSFDTTPYSNIMKLPPAHCLTITTDKCDLRQYFHFSGETTLQLNSSQEYVDAYKEVLEESIRCRMRSDFPIGTELSGGLDSSTITAFASHLLPKPKSHLHAFGFACYEKDQEFIEAVINACPVVSMHWLPGTIKIPEHALLDRALSLTGYPLEVDFAYEQAAFYDQAESLNIRTMLSGFGGDEFVSTYSALARIELLATREYKQLYRTTPGNPLARLARILKLFLRWQRNKQRTYNPLYHDTYLERWRNQPIRDIWVKKYNLYQRYMDETLLDSGYSNLNAYTLEQQWSPFIPTRMENCTLLAAANTLETRWPLLDIRLIKLFLSIPASEKSSHDISRLLHRRAIDGLVPDKVTWNKSKDMGPILNQEILLERENLVEYLHPTLSELIDIEKMNIQVERVFNQSENIDSEKAIAFIYTMENIKQLNQWLQQQSNTTA